ncbi:MAG: hypothetical protein WCK86_14750 [Planctomycetia bacterium]
MSRSSIGPQNPRLLKQPAADSSLRVGIQTIMGGPVPVVALR